MFVGTILYGYCGGFFSSYTDKRIEGIGSDWLVVREIKSDATVDLATFGNTQEMIQFIKKHSQKIED